MGKVSFAEDAGCDKEGGLNFWNIPIPFLVKLIEENLITFERNIRVFF